MREFLFRGKQVFFNDWIEGTGIFNDGINTWLSFNEPEKAIAYGLNHKRVHAETIGEFTGLTDKNGKRIFEGDIVNGFNDLHQRLETYKVKWACNNGFYFVDDCETEWHPEHIENVEVIGNIHDNPELLENP